MHFSKTYAELLVTLPPELRNNAFEYRKLKQLINQTTRELDSLGLGPSVLRSLHEHEHSLAHFVEQDDSESDETLSVDTESVSDASQTHTIVYEIVSNSSGPSPRLRLSSGHPSHVTMSTHHNTTSKEQPIYHADLLISDQLFGRIMQALLHLHIMIKEDSTKSDNSDLIIPLPSDTAFFHLLASTLSSLSGHCDTLQEGFNSALTSLAASISLTARPASSSAPQTFSAYSPTADNTMSLRPKPPVGGKSDLYTWRDIFRLYAETEVFESVIESTRGERTIEEVAKQLKLFQGRVQDKKTSLLLPGSREAFDVFLNLNMFILDVKKFQLANLEATRKILKKHTKRTTLPIPNTLLNAYSPAASSHQLTLIRPSTSLPRILVQAIGEVLIPVVPHIDDYMCLICTSIAFKPIRLYCGHFFCVRCLVKMQKRGMPSCPMCRAPTVLQANPSNIDYGLLNFMADWFPIESLEKLRANEQEVTKEQLEAFGIADAHVCRIM